MAYRPYPNVDRALRQLTRHRKPVAEVPSALRPLVTAMAQMRAESRRVLAAWRPDFAMDARTGSVTPFPVGEYRLSTRPVVGGGR